MYDRIYKEPCAFIWNFNGLHRTLITFAIFLIFNLNFFKANRQEWQATKGIFGRVTFVC